MDWFRSYTKTKLHDGSTWRSLSILQKIFWNWDLKNLHNNTEEIPNKA